MTYWKYQNDKKKLWDAIKEIIGKAKLTKDSFPKRMIIDGHDIFDQGKINCFNEFFVDIGPKLASMIPELKTRFDQYLNPHQTFMGEANLIDDELREASKSLKLNKNPGCDSISSNVVNETSHIFFARESFVTTGHISRKLKNCKGAPSLQKRRRVFLLINYRQNQFFRAFLNCWNE